MTDRGSRGSERQVRPGARGRSGWWTGSVAGPGGIGAGSPRVEATPVVIGRRAPATHQTSDLTNPAIASARTATAAEPAVTCVVMPSDGSTMTSIVPTADTGSAHAHGIARVRARLMSREYAQRSSVARPETTACFRRPTTHACGTRARPQPPPAAHCSVPGCRRAAGRSPRSRRGRHVHAGTRPPPVARSSRSSRA